MALDIKPKEAGAEEPLPLDTGKASENKAPEAKDKKNTKSARPRKNVKWTVVVLLVLVLAAVGGWFAYKYNQAQNDVERLKNPQEAARTEAEILKERVAKLAEVPADETPTVATVTDASKLKSQAFFANAENGDKVLIFSNAKKAILYRQSTNKVITIAPVNIGQDQQQQPQTGH